MSDIGVNRILPGIVVKEAVTEGTSVPGLSFAKINGEWLWLHIIVRGVYCFVDHHLQPQAQNHQA